MLLTFIARIVGKLKLKIEKERREKKRIGNRMLVLVENGRRMKSES
jgi:hypothetical protein